jgi:hypothetical protein
MGTYPQRAVPILLSTRLPPPVPLLPESSLRACCSRDISASIAVINLDVFIGVPLLHEAVRLQIRKNQLRDNRLTNVPCLL